nr:unnamed protein product [Digitaria exilis]
MGQLAWVGLRHNQFTGSLPSTMSNNLTHIDIGYNQFVGGIPSVAVGLVDFVADSNWFYATIGSGMPLLQQLNLANNNLFSMIR